METLNIIKEEWTELADFLKSNLRSQVTWSLQDEYPIAFSEQNLKNLQVIKKDGHIVAHAALLPTIVQTPYHLFKVGLVGSVVTDPNHRGQGLSKQTLASCEESARLQNCDLMMLWSDMHQYYHQLGYEIVGQEVALQFQKPLDIPNTQRLRFLNSNQVSADALLKVYNRHSLKSLRSTRDVRKFLKIPNSHVLTAWNTLSGELEAYAVIGKGADFQNYVHEWGGWVSSLLALLNHHIQNHPAPLTLITHPQAGNLIRQSIKYGAKQHTGFLGMMKIANPVSFCKKIRKGVRAQGYQDFVFEYHDSRFYFGNSTEIYQTDSQQDILRLVFGPLNAEVMHPFHPDVLALFKEVFPIAFWVWGWDSI